MQKSKIRALIAASLSIVMVFTSGGLSSFANEFSSSLQNKSIYEYDSSKLIEQNMVTPGFVISPDINTASNEVVSVIVELKEEPIAIAKLSNKRSSDSKIKDEHENFINGLHSEIIPLSNENLEEGIEVTNEFFNVFNGVVLNVQANKLPEIAKMPQVKTIWNNKEIRLPEENISQPFATAEGGITQIGVDKLQDENITGEGIKVGVIDTGIDYNHPQLKEAYKGGYDFVNNDDDPMETTYDDWKDEKYMPEFLNGNSYYTSHGTHVAGTIAANGAEGKAKGIAPNVDLYSYKVLGPYGSGQTAWVLAGIEKAVEDGMDVINLSLGSSANDPLYPTSIAINNAAKVGVIPVVAAGNSGPNEYTLGSPGTSPLAITVGASDTNLIIPTFDGQVSDENIEIKLLANSYDFDLASLKSKSYEIVNCGLGKPQDFNGKDLSGKIAVIQRGEIAFVEKIANAKKAGAELIFVYNNLDDYINVYLEDGYDYIPTFNLSRSDGEALIKNIEENNMFTFNNISSEFQLGDKLADFSSRGPVGGNFEIKPDIVAPGVNIYSTYPEFINHKEDGEDYSKAYAKISGTSMASPHVAGVVALMLQDARSKGGTMSSQDVKVALMNSADELNGDYNVYEKGAGRINAYNAVKDSISIKINNPTKTIENNEVIEIDNITGSLQFGSTYAGEATKSRKVKIANSSNIDKEFNITITNSVANGNIKDENANGVDLDIPDVILVPANSSIEVDITIDIPQSAEKGFYEGTIILTNVADDKEDYVIPYAIRYSERGIGTFALTRNVISDDKDYYHEYFNPTLGYTVSYNSAVTEQSLYLKDAETGKRIGFIKRYTNLNILPDKTYIEFPAFSGKYIPMIGDYLENRVALAKEGHYILELEAKDMEGNIFTAEQDVFIDNTPPEIILEDGKGFGLHEVSRDDYTVENGIEAYYVKGRIYDDTIEKLNELGYTEDMFGNPINQKANNMLYYQQLPNERSPYYSGTMNIDDEGNFSIGVLPEEIENNPTEVSLFPYDYGTAGDYNKEKYLGFIKEGDAYGEITYDKDKVVKGDTQVGHVNFKNMKDVTSLEFVVGFSKKVYELEDITVTTDFQEYVESKGGKVNIVHEPTRDFPTEDVTGEAHKVVVNIEGLSEGIDIIDKMSVLDIKATVVNDDQQFSYIDLFYTKSNSRNKYTDANGNTNNLWIMSFMNWYKFIPKTSNNSLYFISAQGFFDENGYSKRLDCSKMGASAYIITPNGERIDAEINQYGYATVSVPTSLEEAEFYVEVPGHFKNKVRVAIGQDFEGDTVGVQRVDSILTAYAGDMNGDNIIDDKDRNIIEADKGKTTEEGEIYLASDLNKDRVVNEKDLVYITNNFGMVNPRLMEDAEAAMAKLLQDKNRENLSIAKEKVEMLPECKEKEDFKNTLDGISNEFNVYKNHLNIAIEEAEKVTEEELSKVVPAVVDAFRQALNNAKAVIVNDKATQIEVDTAFEELSKAMHMLSFFKGDKTQLINLVDKINGLNGNEYIESTWTKLQNNLAEANKVIADENALEAEVSKSYDGLLRSFLELRLKPNKDKLQELINQANSLKQEEYTTESWNNFKAVLNQANMVYENNDATEQEVASAEINLSKAMDSLVKADGNNNGGQNDNSGQDSNNGQQNNNGQNNNNGGSNKPTNKLPQTGAPFASGAVATLGLLTAAAGAIVSKKRK